MAKTGRSPKDWMGPQQVTAPSPEASAATTVSPPTSSRSPRRSWEEMERDERVYLLGEDIGVYGGAFKVTEGFVEHFGTQRVMDTPIAEETIVGMAVGSAMEGLRPVAEFQYADFMSSGFDEITTVLARYHYRTGVPSAGRAARAVAAAACAPRTSTPPTPSPGSRTRRASRSCARPRRPTRRG